MSVVKVGKWKKLYVIETAVAWKISLFFLLDVDYLLNIGCAIATTSRASFCFIIYTSSVSHFSRLCEIKSSLCGKRFVINKLRMAGKF